MTITRKHLVESICNEIDCSRGKSIELVETVIELITETLENEEDVMISGFGKFCVRDKNTRKGRNPATGETMMLPARKVVTFKCSGKLRDRVNGEA